MISFGTRFQLQFFIVIVIRLLANGNFHTDASLLFHLGGGGES